MKLYNTLTRTVEKVEPQNSPQVTVYTCGPTVYDYAHIGHWFTYIRMDILIRTLKSNSLEPNWVMNITDVGHLVSDADEGEDKLEKGARREGKSAWEIAEYYTQDFLNGMQTLNILSPSVMPRATAHIPEQIALIQQLEAKGFTYIISDGVYYDTSKFPNYNLFAQLDLDEQQAGARVTINPEKRNSADFALWKFSPKDRAREMEWESPWGKGFPGWHIECSAMSMKYLGETIDVHTGGIDHVPVHHTNEIAQSEAATGKRFAKYWMHGNHVMVNGEKISKSLGNGIRLQEITEKGILPEAVRLHVLESHYRSQSKFSWESLEAAQNRLKNLQAMAVLRWQTREHLPDAVTFSYIQAIDHLKTLLADDLNTPAALAFLSEIETQVSTVLLDEEVKQDFVTLLEAIDDQLGLTLSSQSDISDEQKVLIQEREAARDNKEWAKSDELRDTLEAQGISLRDTEHGTIWRRL